MSDPEAVVRIIDDAGRLPDGMGVVEWWEKLAGRPATEDERVVLAKCRIVRFDVAGYLIGGPEDGDG